MSAPGVLKKPATYQDLQQVPHHLVAEILDGELYATPRPRLHHAYAATRIGIEIGGAFGRDHGGPGGWWILHEPELHLHTDVVVPDVAGWRRDRMMTLPDAAAMDAAPDWVCEVISPSTEGMDRGRKLGIYAREGVLHVWLINPSSQTFEVLALSADRWTLLATHVGGVVIRAEPFDAIEIDLSALWHPAPQP